MRTILQLGHPILRLIAEPVSNISSPEIQTLVGDMLDMVKELHCSGLAAPQVGESLRLFIYGDKDKERFAAINPAILAQSEEIVTGWERCLSIPNLYARIPRASSIHVEYFDTEGNKIQKHLSQYEARIFQHELDHLNGLVYFDRIRDMRNIVTDIEFKERYSTNAI